MGPLYPERNQRIAAWAHAAAVASDPPAPTNPEARNLHDQENAQRIELQDLHCEGKQSTGVVYGYIGTSPLYVFSSTFAQQPTWHDLVGALSIIIWSLTIIVTIKYCFIVLSANDGGQGGTFAVYTLLARHASIVRTDPNGPRSLIDGLDRRTDTELSRAGRCLRNFIETSRGAKIGLKLIGIMGVSMTLADSVLAPAQSVLGAVQGIQVPLGTSKIGTFFAPIVLIWLLFNLGVGIYNLIEYDHTVLKAFSPYFAFAYLYGSSGWKSLSGLLLAITGVESLFAALGAFGKPIYNNNSSHNTSRASSRDIRDNSSACQLAYDNILFAPGLGIFFDKVGGPSDHIPEVFTHFVHKFRTRPQVVIFFHMRSLSQPTIPADQRFVIARVNSNIPSCYHIVLRHGYMDDVLTSNLTRIVIGELMVFIMRDSFEPSEDELPSDIRQELESLRAAEDTQTVYLIGKQILRVQKKDGNCIKCLMRRGALGVYLWIRENFNGRLANLDIDPESLVEVGFIKEI
uniref:Uncharacterized protein n=1 Tax=Fusarium oxysporum (strain Fo5176) TaxID=660025 RepID=A0A0D2XRT4_FUSOF